MKYNELDEIFNNEIKNREESPEWNSRIVSNVLQTVRKERRRNIAYIISCSFPVLAAALLFVLIAGLSQKPYDEYELLKGESRVERNLLSNVFDLSYDIDYYIF